jgi:adenylate cyclase
LSESLPPAELQDLLNRYYKLLFAPVRARDGMISDVVGDAMLAIWSAPQEVADLRRKACAAALEIKRALELTDTIPSMPTRIGLHAGELMLSHVGAIDHYEYRAVGDIVNTASRIENLNKQMGTKILVSQETVEGLDGFVTRELGMFRLKGKQRALLIHELMSEADATTPEQLRLVELFAEALQAHRAGERREATERFQSILQAYPQDGPSRFYLDRYDGRTQSGEVVVE